MAQELIVERRRTQQRLELGERGGIVAKNLERRGALVAEQKFDRAVLRRLEARRLSQHRAERLVLRRRERLQHRPLLEELLLDELDPGERLEACRELIGLHVADCRPELVDHQLHPQLGGLVLDDEQHLVVTRRLFRGPGQRLLRRQQPVEAEITGIRKPVAKIGDDAGFEVVLRHDRCARETRSKYRGVRFS